MNENENMKQLTDLLQIIPTKGQYFVKLTVLTLQSVIMLSRHTWTVAKWLCGAGTAFEGAALCMQTCE